MDALVSWPLSAYWGITASCPEASFPMSLPAWLPVICSGWFCLSFRNSSQLYSLTELYYKAKLSSLWKRRWMSVPAPWQAARALRAEVRWAPAPALLQDPLGGPGHLTTVQTHGTVPSKQCHEHTGKTRCPFPYITLPEAHADIGATPATVIKYFKDRSQITSTYNWGEGSPKIARYRKGLQQLTHTIEGRPLCSLLTSLTWGHPDSTPCTLPAWQRASLLSSGPARQPFTGGVTEPRQTLREQQVEAYVGQIWVSLIV